MDVDDEEHELADDGLDIDMTSGNGSTATKNGIGDQSSEMNAEADSPRANDARDEGEAVAEIPEPDRKVTYLHRTAKDFLESPDMQNQILTMSPPGFDRHVAILSGYLLLLKTLPVEGIDRVTLWRMVVDFLNLASESEASAEVSLTEYIDELDKTADIMFRAHGFSGEKCHWTATRQTSADSKYEVGFLLLAAEFNLRRYIVSKLELGVPLFLLGDGRPILDYVIEDFAKYPSLCEPSTVAPEGSVLPCLRVIKTLLDRGENPNARYKDSTTWERVLDEVSKVAKNPGVEDEKKRLLLRHWAVIVEAFIAHDADPVVNRNSPLGSKIREIFGPWVPQRAEELEKQLKRTRRRWSIIGKFITPRNWKLERLTLETTPLPILRRLESAIMAPPQPSAPVYHVEDLANRDGFSGANHPDQILREEARHRGPWEVSSSRQLLTDDSRFTDDSRYWEDFLTEHPPYISAYSWDSVLSEQTPPEKIRLLPPAPSEQIPSEQVRLLPPAILCSFNRLYRLSNGFWSSILITSIAARHGVRRRLVLEWYECKTAQDDAACPPSLSYARSPGGQAMIIAYRHCGEGRGGLEGHEDGRADKERPFVGKKGETSNRTPQLDISTGVPGTFKPHLLSPQTQDKKGKGPERVHVSDQPIRTENKDTEKTDEDGDDSRFIREVEAIESRGGLNVTEKEVLGMQLGKVWARRLLGDDDDSL